MSVPIIGVEPALVGMLSAAESAGAATMAAGTSGAAPVMTTVLPPGSDPASMAVAAGRARLRWNCPTMSACRCASASIT